MVKRDICKSHQSELDWTLMKTIGVISNNIVVLFYLLI